MQKPRLNAPPPERTIGLLPDDPYPNEKAHSHMLNPLLQDVPQVIETDRLILRCPKAGDGQAVFAAVRESLPELRRYLAAVPWVAEEPSVEASEVYCRTAYSNFIARKDMPYLIFERRTSLLVGGTGLHRPNWEVPKFEVGYWCRTAQTGQGYISEAVRTLACCAEEELGALRIELITDAENQRSRTVAERCGFTLEGLLRNDRRAPDGSLRDICIYARTAQPD